MKNQISFLLFSILSLLGFQPACQAMDNATPTPTACPEQQLIDAMKSEQTSEDIMRRFFAKPPLGIFNGSEDINYQDKKGNTPLMVAVTTNRIEVVEKITRDYSPKLSIKNKDGKTIYDLGENESQRIRIIKEYDSLKSNSAIEFCKKTQCNDEQYQEFVKLAECVNSPQDFYGICLDSAIEACNDGLSQKLAALLSCNLEEKITEFLCYQVRAGVWDTYDDSDATDKAFCKNFNKIIKHYKTYIHCKNTEGLTLLAKAVQMGSMEATDILLRHGANPQDTITINNPDGTSTTQPLLFYAAIQPRFFYNTHYGYGAIVCSLIAHGANINTQDDNGDTVFILAIQNPNVEYISSEYISSLLGMNAIDIDIKNKKGQSALDIFLAKANNTTQHTTILLMLFAKKTLGYTTNRPYDQQSDAICKMCKALLEDSIHKTGKDFGSTKALFRKMVELYGLNYTSIPCMVAGTNNYFYSMDSLMPLLQDPQNIHHSFACECAAAILPKVHDDKQIWVWEKKIYNDKNIGLLKAFLSYKYRFYEVVANELTKNLFTPYSKTDAERYKDIINNNTNREIYITNVLDQCITTNFPAGIKSVCEYNFLGNYKLIEIANNAGLPPLSRAIMLGHLECVQELLNHGCNPNPPHTKTVVKDGTEQIITTEGDSIALAQQYCPQAVPLLEHAQRTTIYHLPHDALRKILSFVPSRFGFSKDRLQNINTVTQTSKNILAAVSHWNDNDPTLNAWLLSVQNKSDEGKKAIFQDQLEAKKYNYCCALLRHNPQLVIPTQEDENPLLLQLITSSPLPPFELFETVINCILLNDPKKPLALNIESTYNTACYNDRECLNVKFDTCAAYNNKLTIMDIAVCRLVPILWQKSGLSTTKEADKKTLQQLLTLLRKHGNTLSQNIVIQIAGSANRDNYTLLELPYLILPQFDPWFLEFLIGDPSIDINVETYGIYTGTLLSLLTKLKLRDGIKILLKHPKINVNKIDEHHKTTLDYFDYTGSNNPVAIGSPESLKLINEIIIFKTLRDAGAKTAIELAIEKKDLKLFNTCLQNRHFKKHMQGALHIIPNLTTVPTVMNLCIDAEFIDGIQALINAGHNLNHVDGNKEYPLIYALKHKKRDCALLLIGAEADVNCFDAEGNPPLAWAIKNCDMECVQKLLNHRCNPNPSCNIVIENFLSQKVTVHNVLKLANICFPDAVPLLFEAQQTTIHHLPAELVNKIIGHVPTQPGINQRFNIVSSVAQCCKKMYLDATSLFKNDGTSPEDQAWREILSKVEIATKNRSDQELEKLLWEALENKQYKTLKALLITHPQLVNSRNPISGENILVELLRATINQVDPPLGIIKCIIDIDKFTNKQVTLLNQKSNLALYIGSRRFFTFQSIVKTDPADANTGVSAMDMVLYNLSNIDQNTRGSWQESKQSWKVGIEYLIAQGGYFNTNLECIITGGHQMFRHKTGIKPTLGILFMDSLINTLDALELFLRASPSLDINAPIERHHHHEPILCWAASLSQYKVVELLLARPDININAISPEGLTALDCCLKASIKNNNTLACIALLQSREAKTAAQLNPQPAAAQPQAPAAINNPPLPAAPQLDIQQNPAPALDNNGHGAAAPAPAPVPGNNPPIIKSHWYKSPAAYWIAALAACGACGYGIYNYFWRDTEDEVDEETIYEPA